MSQSEICNAIVRIARRAGNGPMAPTIFSARLAGMLRARAETGDETAAEAEAAMN